MPDIRSEIMAVFISDLNTARIDSASEISVLASPQPNEDQTPANARTHEHAHAHIM